MKKILTLTAILCLSNMVLISNKAVCQVYRESPDSYYETTKDYKIDWTKHFLVVEGRGTYNKDLDETPAEKELNAIDAAEMNADAQLARAIDLIRVDIIREGERRKTDKNYVKTALTALLRGVIKIDEKYDPRRGIATVKLAMPLRYTSIADELNQLWEFNDKAPEPPTETRTYEEINKIRDAEQEEKVSYTGLVIDARHLSLRPTPYFQIYDEKGNEIYDTKILNKEWVTKFGLADYHKDLKMARKNPRVAGNPLVLKALKSGNNNSYVVLSNRDVQRLKEAIKQNDFLKEARVAVVL